MFDYPGWLPKAVLRLVELTILVVCELNPAWTWLPPYLCKDTLWIAVSALFSALVAVATFMLAWSTKKLADETLSSLDEARLSRELADKHHQEALLPFVAIRAEMTKSVLLENGRRHTEYVLRGSIVNVGPGPALSVSVYLTVEGEPQPQVYTAAPMGGNSTDSIEIRWSLWDEARPGNQSQSMPHAFRVKVSYTSAFETKGFTSQHSPTGRMKDLWQLDDTEPPKATNRPLPFVQSSRKEASEQ